jgi:hypothetical protein
MGVACARSICVHYPGYFIVIKRLFPTASDGTCEACPLGKPAVAANPRKTNQGEFAKTASGCQSQTEQGDFSEAPSCQKASRIKRAEFSDSAAAKEA